MKLKNWGMMLFFVLIGILFINFVKAADLNFTIKGNINDASASFNALVNENAVRGLDVYDVAIAKDLPNETVFYSTILNAVYLSIDAWNASFINSRTLNLTFKTDPLKLGVLNLSWRFNETYFDAYLIDYGVDWKYLNNLTDRINMKHSNSYAVNSDGIRYFQLKVNYLYQNYIKNLSINDSREIDKNCNESFFCSQWGECQNLDKSLSNNLINKLQYSSFRGVCDNLDYDSVKCGFQVRECDFLGFCNDTSLVITSRVCEFVKNPDCEDEIKNCHDESCEADVDCGGPCGPCPTCLDKEQNQGEEGVDCGGPCEKECGGGIKKMISKINFKKFSQFLFVVFIEAIFFSLVFFVAYLIKRKNKREAEELTWYNLK